MPDHQGRPDFPEVADEKINIGGFNEWAPLGVSDIYSPKEEPKLRDQVMLDQAAMLKEICTLIESFGKKSAKKVEDPYKGSSIQKATGWTMDKQNPQDWGEDAYYQPPSKKELKSGHATMSGEKSEKAKSGIDKGIDPVAHPKEAAKAKKEFDRAIKEGKTPPLTAPNPMSKQAEPNAVRKVKPSPKPEKPVGDYKEFLEHEKRLGDKYKEKSVIKAISAYLKEDTLGKKDKSCAKCGERHEKGSSVSKACAAT